MVAVPATAVDDAAAAMEGAALELSALETVALEAAAPDAAALEAAKEGAALEEAARVQPEGAASVGGSVTGREPGSEGAGVMRTEGKGCKGVASVTEVDRMLHSRTLWLGRE